MGSPGRRELYRQQRTHGIQLPMEGGYSSQWLKAVPWPLARLTVLHGHKGPYPNHPVGLELRIQMVCSWRYPPGVLELQARLMVLLGRSERFPGAPLGQQSRAAQLGF